MPEIEEEVYVNLDELLAPLHHIVLYNDDVNSFDHVIDCLVKYCDHLAEQAEQCAYIVHHKGKCSVKNGAVVKLKPIHEALLENGLSAAIESY
jgi:ATP-dependent Clp protease adaptor protein ClpS